MTQSERDWTMQVHTAAMEIVDICGLLSVEAPSGSVEARRGDQAALKALALAQKALNRIHAAGMAADQDELQESTTEILLSIPQAAKRLGITRSAVHYAIQAQKLLAQRVGHRWILRAEDVDAYRVRQGRGTSDRKQKASQRNAVLARAAWKRARGQKNVASEQCDKAQPGED